MGPKRSLPVPADKIADRERRIALANEAIESGRFTSLSAAAEAYGVSNNTLGRRRKGGLTPGQAHGHQQRLPPTAEEDLAKYLRLLMHGGFPGRVSVLAKQAAQLLQQVAPSSDPVGTNWPYSFLRRNQDLESRYLRKPKRTESSATYTVPVSNDPTIVRDWLRDFEAKRAEFDIRDEDIYNLDEMAFNVGLTQEARFIVLRDRRRRRVDTPPHGGDWVSIIECISLDGRAIPPFVILKQAGPHVPLRKVIDAALPGSTAAVSEVGWSSYEHGAPWIRHFEQYTRRDLQRIPKEAESDLDVDGNSHRWNRYRMLIMDTHVLHTSLDFAAFCWTNQIVPICLPQRCTQVLQPFNVGIFNLLKQVYASKIDEYAFIGYEAFSRQLVLQIYGSVRDSIFTTENIRKSFTAAGFKFAEPEGTRNYFRGAITRATSPPFAVFHRQPPPDTRSGPITPPAPAINPHPMLIGAAATRPSATPVTHAASATGDAAAAQDGTASSVPVIAAPPARTANGFPDAAATLPHSPDRAPGNLADGAMRPVEPQDQNPLSAASPAGWDAQTSFKALQHLVKRAQADEARITILTTQVQQLQQRVDEMGRAETATQQTAAKPALTERQQKEVAAVLRGARANHDRAARRATRQNRNTQQQQQQDELG